MPPWRPRQRGDGREPVGWLDTKFTAYLADRRENPRNDVLTLLAKATYRDGTVPELVEVVRTATFLFAAGRKPPPN